MFRDPLQERLGRMEAEKPSENQHHQGMVKDLKDTVYFFSRHVDGSVKTIPQMTSRYRRFSDREDDCRKAVKEYTGYTGDTLNRAIDYALKCDWRGVQLEFSFLDAMGGIADTIIPIIRDLYIASVKSNGRERAVNRILLAESFADSGYWETAKSYLTEAQKIEEDGDFGLQIPTAKLKAISRYRSIERALNAVDVFIEGLKHPIEKIRKRLEHKIESLS